MTVRLVINNTSQIDQNCLILLIKIYFFGLDLVFSAG